MTITHQFIVSGSVPQAFQPASRRQIRRLGARGIVRAVSAMAVAGMVALLAGCATEPAPKEVRLAWPEAPEVARIEFVRTIVDDKDLTKDTTGSQTLFRFLAGDTASKFRIVEPMGLAVSDDGHRLYISDFAQFAVFVFDFDKKTALKIDGGDKDSLGAPMGVALDADENIYVAETGKRNVRVFDRTGKSLRSITDPSLERPLGLAIDIPRGKLYVADTGRAESPEHSVKIFDLQGKLLGRIGKQIGDVPGSFLFPTYVNVDAKGNLYVGDTLNSRVQMFDPDGKFVQAFGKRGNAFGMFDKPKGVATDSFGNVYVADSGWSNVQIFNEKGGILMFFGGRGTAPGLMQNPSVLTIDKQNRIYVGDVLNHRVNVYRLVNTTAEDSMVKVTEAAKAAEAAKTAEAAKAAPAKK